MNLTWGTFVQDAAAMRAVTTPSVSTEAKAEIAAEAPAPKAKATRKTTKK